MLRMLRLVGIGWDVRRICMQVEAGPVDSVLTAVLACLKTHTTTVETLNVKSRRNKNKRHGEPGCETLTFDDVGRPLRVRCAYKFKM